MKRPYFNLTERQHIALGTIKGIRLNFHLEIKRFLMQIKKEEGHEEMKRAEKAIEQMLNTKVNSKKQIEGK